MSRQKILLTICAFGFIGLLGAQDRDVHATNPLSRRAHVPAKEYVVTKLIRVYDGYTFLAELSIDGVVHHKKVGVRLSQIDTPKIAGRCFKEKRMALAARKRLFGILYGSFVIRVVSYGRGYYTRK